MTFNDNNIATAFEQLSDKAGSLSKDELKSQVFESAGFKQLVQMAKEETDNFNPRQLAGAHNTLLTNDLFVRL